MYELIAYGLVESQNQFFSAEFCRDPRMWASSEEQVLEYIRDIVKKTQEKGGFVSYEINQARPAEENETIIVVTRMEGLVPTFAGGAWDIPDV